MTDLDVIDCTGVILGNDDLASSCAWVPPNPIPAPLPIYPQREDLPHAA